MQFLYEYIIVSTVRGLMPALREHAYLDPGSGSFILQLIVASLLGGLFLMRRYWNKIISFFRNLFTRDNNKD
ncbi:MAG: hypothetical protein ACK2TU_05965 [Anaerolineales bacterium]